MTAITKTIKVEKEVVEDVVCNKCGGTCLIGGDRYGAQALVEDGYHTKLLMDAGLLLEFHLCEDCTGWLFKTFTVPMRDHRNEGSYDGATGSYTEDEPSS